VSGTVVSEETQTRAADTPSTPNVGPETAGSASARATRLLFVGQIIGKLLRFGTDVLIGRMLGPVGLGTIAASMSVVQIVSEVGLLGSHRAVVRHASHGPGADRAQAVRWGLAIAGTVSGAFALACIVFRESLQATLLPAAPAWVVPAFALTIPMIAIASVLQYRARASRRFWVDTAIGNLARNGFPFAITAVLLLLGYGLLGATIGYVAGIAATLLLAVVLHRREPVGGASTLTVRRFAATALPLALASASILLMNELDKVMLAIFRTEAEVGIYNAAFRISRQTVLLLPALNAAISPWVAPLLAEGRHDDLRRLYRQTTKWSLAAGWAAALVFVTFAPECLSLFGPGYVTGASTLVLLALGQAVNSAAGNAGVVLQFSGHQQRELVIGLWGIGTNVVLNVALIPRFGATGAAWATVASLVLIAALRVVAVRGVLGCLPYDRETLRVLAGGLLGAAMAWSARAIIGAAGGADGIALTAAIAAMGGTWLVLVRRVGVSADEAALLKLPRSWVRKR